MQSQRNKYRNAPGLSGYCYTPEEAYEARDNGRVLSLRLETSLKCDLRCKYCCNNSGEAVKNEIRYEKLIDLIREAGLLGARSVIVIGGGEPTIYPHFRELVSYVATSDMIPVVFTNAMSMNRDLAEFLFDANASVITKLDSLREDIQDRLVGRSGAFRSMRRGLDELLSVGFADATDESRLRLGVSFVVGRTNMSEIPDIWVFCRDKGLFPNLEMMVPNGRGGDMMESCLSKAEWRRLKLELLEIDRSHYGFDWLPFTPLIGGGCLQVLYNVYVTVGGMARPCSSIHAERAGVRVSVHDMTLTEILQSPLFKLARYTEKNLQGKCGECPHKRVCLGCRGMAFATAMNDGKSVFEAICAEDPTCFRID